MFFGNTKKLEEEIAIKDTHIEKLKIKLGCLKKKFKRRDKKLKRTIRSIK